jgi:hypothetical protein
MGEHPDDGPAMPAKDDCNQLLNAALPFAEQMLREHGEFLPFGAQMLPDGEIVSVAVDDGEDHSRSQNLIDALQTAYKAGAADGEFVATALVYDVRVVPPGASEKTDAIALNLDHRDSYSVTVFFPYILKDGEPEVGDAFASGGDYSIFPSPSPLHA